MQTSELEVIESCEGCGACCMTMCSPGYTAAIKGEKYEPNEYLGEMEKYALNFMPTEARAVLDDYMTRLDAGEFGDGIPCCWLDLETRQCRFYEFRPEVCREFELGGDGCRGYREEFGVGEDK